MEYFRLTLGLLLPWIGGYYWLAAIEKRFNHNKNPNTLRQIGYGLFLGYAALQGLVLASATLLNHVAFWPVLTFVALLSAAGVLLLKIQANANRVQTVADHKRDVTNYAVLTPHSPFARILLVFLLGWITLHLALDTLEILNRPVYPWDAWLAWIYRAKAWFYSENIYQLASPKQWLAGTETVPYTIAAHGYPGFASIIPFWAAISLGHWSETLINVPVLCWGIALGLGIYGQCREYGISVLHSVVAAYFLLSMPLLGTHLSLAGYADIWLAGFTGLGFAALITGMASKNKFQIFLGLSMVALGISVKNEGLVWFYLALLMVLLASVRSRVIIAVAATLCLLGTIGWSTGFTYMELPLVGGTGILDGSIHIPLVGSHRIQPHNIVGPYFNSFFAFGNWHLLWALLVFVIGSLFFIRRAPAAKIIGLFLLIFLASQAFIFGLTEQGRWATSYTAINRLPLHFAPALVLCLFVGLHHLRVQPSVNATDNGNIRQHRFKLLPLSLPAIISALLVAVGTTLFLLPEHSSSAEPRQFSAQDLRLVVGGGQMRNDTAHVTRFQNGFAVASSGPITLDAADLQVLNYNLTSSNPKPPSFFWRLASQPSDIKIVDIESTAEGILRLSNQPSWKGKITEIGVTFYGDKDHTAQITQLTLTPDSLKANAEALWNGWTAFEPWSQTSVNWLAGGRTGLKITAPLLLGAWLVGALILYGAIAAIPHKRSSAIAAFGLCALIAWCAIDVRWTTNRLKQALITLNAEELRSDKACIDLLYDCTLPELAHRIEDEIPAEQGKKILIAYENSRDNFRALRLKYRLLPLPAITKPGTVKNSPKKAVDYVLLLKHVRLTSGNRGKTKESASRTIWDTPESLFFDAQHRQ